MLHHCSCSHHRVPQEQVQKYQYSFEKIQMYHIFNLIIYTNMGLDPLTMMDWYCMDNDDSLYLSGCQSTKQRHAFCNRII